MRTAVRAQAQPSGVVDALTVRADRLTTDWVTTYVPPDGIRGLSDTAAARLTPALAAAIFGNADPQAVVSRVRADLAKPAAPDLMTPDRLDRGDPAEAFDLSAGFVATLAQRLIAIIPTEREMEAQRRRRAHRRLERDAAAKPDFDCQQREHWPVADLAR